ncbi:MAG: hypothetical protein OEW68_16505 [Gammaproteobacteria bacterium]|nr:hypothetical protein [Gammaproteobacteria bacterium]MDH4316424.1 hypothetical protein [Gammaproteobacteria bacterium]
MNSMINASRLRNFAATLTTIATLGATFQASAVPQPQAAFPVCFGSFGFVASAGPFVDINGSPGLETIVPHRSVTIEADLDADFLAVAHTTYIVNYHDESGTLVWQRPGLGVSSNEVMTALPGFDLLSVGTNFMPPLQMIEFYTLGFVCEGVGVAEAGGNTYVVLSAGAAAAEGSADAGTDLSKIRIWVLNKDNGNVVFTHTLAGQPGRFMIPQSSGVLDIDGDGDDELVVVRSEYRPPAGGKERVFIHTEWINLVTGVSEGNTTVNYSISMDNQNNP